MFHTRWLCSVSKRTLPLIRFTILSVLNWEQSSSLDPAKSKGFGYPTECYWSRSTAYLTWFLYGAILTCSLNSSFNFFAEIIWNAVMPFLFILYIWNKQTLTFCIKLWLDCICCQWKTMHFTTISIYRQGLHANQPIPDPQMKSARVRRSFQKTNITHNFVQWSYISQNVLLCRLFNG